MTRYSVEEPDFDWAVPPGRLLQREIDARGLSQAQLAAQTGLSTKHINLLIKGHASLSPDVAIALEQVLGSQAETWLRMEVGFQAHEARVARSESLEGLEAWIARFPADVLSSIGVTRRQESSRESVSRLLAFFRVATPAAFERTWLEPQASYKRSQAHEIDPYGTALWLRMAEVRAEVMAFEAPEYDQVVLKEVVRQLPPLTTQDVAEAFTRARDLLLSAGVLLVFVPEFPRTRISGVTRWVNGRPLVAVTSRYKYFDSFWFTLLHELGHVLLHPKRSTYIDVAGRAQDDDDAQETAANRFAEDLLVPRELKAEVMNASTPDAIRQIAMKLGVSPGVIAGQHAFLSHDWGGPVAKLRTRGDLAELLG